LSIQDVIGSLPYGGCPLPDVGTAGQPAESAWADVARAGFRTVVDLRPNEEPRGYDEPAAVRRAGLEYVQIPVTPATLGDRQFDEFRSLMKDPERRPVLVHCASANRVGALLVPYLVLDEGKPASEAIAVAKQVGLKSAEYASMALDYAQRHGARG
jgi:uncharacterized protein (TIGR01244 family)